MHFLDKYNFPNDLTVLTDKELYLLSDEISELIKRVVKKHGGHYSSPLGVVDLAIALHYVYQSPIDKLIWDVGHQSYAHKILTGRADVFDTLRQKNGISGFLKRSESAHDIIGAGHASTSISSGLGIAHARDKQKKDFSVVSIIGDGAMTGGLAYEGMNNLGYHRTQMTVVLNDNSKSISNSVGALSHYLSKIITNPTYNKIRNDIWEISGKLPIFSTYVRKFLKKSEEGLKGFLTPGSLFEELGMRYIGPIDGHDISEMIDVFKSVKDMKTPVLVHVCTKKGKRSASAEDDSIKYYSMSGEVKDKSDGVSYSAIFGDSLSKIAESDDSFACVTAAMEIGTGMASFVKDYPEKCIDVGIAEEHAITYASGLATEGIVPVVPIYSTFMQRAYDQVMHDILLQDLPIVICMDRAGLVGPDGPTHHGVFDITLFNSLPNIILSAPKDGNELRDLLFTAISSKKAFAIRYPKGVCSKYNKESNMNLLEIGKWERLNSGDKICVLAVGSMVDTALKANEKLRETKNTSISIINCRYIKPMDTKLIDELSSEYDCLITLEEGAAIGGFGSMVLDYVNSKNLDTKVHIHGIEDRFIQHGTRGELLVDTGLDVDSVYNIITNLID